MTPLSRITSRGLSLTIEQNQNQQLAVVAGVAPCVPGMLPALGLTASPASPLFASIYDGAWFVGAAISSALYTALMFAGRSGQQTSGSGGGVAAAGA